MAKSNSETITKLNLSKSEFKNAINKRIEIGDELLAREVIDQENFGKLKFDYESWNDYNNEFLKQSFNKPLNEYRKRYANAGYTFMGDMLTADSSNPINGFKGLINNKLADLAKLRDKIELLKSIVQTEKSANENNGKHQILSKKEIFIVHGHDDEAKVKTARFVEKLGFKPIILHEQASSGKTIIEKIESYSNVGFGIVLYTPCDIGSKKIESPELKNRARQNVVFEHGFLIGKIGRENVCALVKGEIETPNDISGVVYVTMDNNEAWEFQIAKELKKSGYAVDMNKL